jgi:hypothetical protein
VEAIAVCPMKFTNLQWKVALCPKCHCLSVESQDGVLGCLKCRESQALASECPDGGCVYCGQPLILLMDACLSCGNQPARWQKL